MGEDSENPFASRPEQRIISGFHRIGDWVDVCVDVLRADSAAVVLSSARNVHHVLQTTDAASARAADLLYVLGAGPHTDAMADGVPHKLVVNDPADARRWPLLMNELAALGVEWVHVFPLGHGTLPMGTLQLLRFTTTVGDGPTRDAEVFVAKLARLCNSAFIANASTVAIDGGHGSNSDAIDVAIEIMRARDSLTTRSASAMLRAEAYTAGRSASEHARYVIESSGGTGTDEEKD